MIWDVSEEKRMICEICGAKTFVIFLTKNHEKVCDKCFEKLKENKD